MLEIPIYKDENASFELRAKDLVSRMTLEEKVMQMLYNAPAIPRLDIPSYNWWNEALHGVARAGVATMFPQAIGLAASFDEQLVFEVADIISTEGRAKYHEFQRKGDHGIYKGLTFWSPNINIFRDPRWGRGHETYGEDPYLTGRLGVAFVKGIQGDDKKYLKAAACAKHYAVHSGPESERHSFNAEVTQKDLWETYLPAFRECVMEAGAAGVMGAYNRTNGEPCCGSETLLKKILREEWGFKGYVTSDCWAIKDFHEYHGVTRTAPESVALAVNNTCDLNCGNMYINLLLAHKEALVTEKAIDECVERLMLIRMKLGMFDNQEKVPCSNISYESNDSIEHNAIALKAAGKSMVLLKNEGGLLPLDKSRLKTIAVIGPNADSRKALIGNYYGTSSEYVTVLEGIQEAVGCKTRVYYAEGCHLYKKNVEGLAEEKDRFAEAVAAAERSDAVIICLGLDATLEGEEGTIGNEYGSGDKPDLKLPGLQQALLEEIHKTGKPVILVLLSGSALAVTWADDNIPAILQAWYPGAQGGRAIASLIFGEYSPSGRLPVTFYRTSEELPDFRDYSMKNRTYRYMKNEALYPFGFGLGYTKFEYSDLSISKAGIQPMKIDEEQGESAQDNLQKYEKYGASGSESSNLTIHTGESLFISVKVRNTGKYDSEEVVQLYLKDVKASVEVPVWQLKGFCKLYIEQEQQKEASFILTPGQMALTDNDGKCILEPGTFEVYIGGCQPDERSRRLSGCNVLKGTFEVVGTPFQMKY